jgi:hypothetical protein
VTNRQILAAGRFSALITVTVALSEGCQQIDRQVQYVAVHQLASDEHVWAYSRIDPSGRFLAYASATSSIHEPIAASMVVWDLNEGKVVFRESGADPYWSVDGERLIFLSQQNVLSPTVSIWNLRTQAVVRDVAPVSLGGYFSWGVRSGRDLILTIDGNYYYLNRRNVSLPPAHVMPRCDDIDVGERPLLSKDGLRATTFVRGSIVIRNLDDCADIIQTGLIGAKADFSWSGRYIAFHAPKKSGSGYEIKIVDLYRRTMRTLTGLNGSSLFPNWTRDDRLCFRYDDDDYRTFMIATNVLSVPEEPLPEVMSAWQPLEWRDLFDTLSPIDHIAVVLIWSTWGLHSMDSLAAVQDAVHHLKERGTAISAMWATDDASPRADVDRMRSRNHIELPEVRIATARLALTGAFNQMPAALLFCGTTLLGRRLGELSVDEVLEWVTEASGPVGCGKSGRVH